MSRGYGAPAVRTGRNETCPCGSGMKYKYCCMYDVVIGRVQVGLDRRNGRVVVDFGAPVGVISFDPTAAGLLADAMRRKRDELAGVAGPEDEEDDDDEGEGER